MSTNSVAGIQRIRIINKEYPFMYVMGSQIVCEHVCSKYPAMNWTYVLVDCVVAVAYGTIGCRQTTVTHCEGSEPA